VDAQNSQQKKPDHEYRGTIFFCYTPSSFVFAQTFVAIRSMVRSPAVSHPGVPLVNEGCNVCQEALRLDPSLTLDGHRLLTASGRARRLVRQSDAHDDTVNALVLYDEEES
jgi:hypothetical protein